MTASASRNSWVGFSSRPDDFATLGERGVRCLCVPDRKVCFWHKSDMLNAPTNVRFGGKAELTNLCLPTSIYEYTPSSGFSVRVILG